MDVARTSFVLIIAALLAGTALAGPPSTSTANFAGQSGWGNTAPTTAPTITASPNNRYAYPQSTQPVTVQPQSVSDRAQSAFNQTTTSLREGFDSGVQATNQQLQSTGNTLRTTTQQTLSPAGSQSTNPWATGQTPAATSTAGGSLAPPPSWPTGSTAPALSTPASTTAPSWSSALTPATPVDHSVLTNPMPIQPNSGWSAIGSSIAAPPMLVPALPASTSSFTPISTTPIDSGPSLTTDSYRGQQSTQSTSGFSPQQSPGTVRSTSGAEDWASGWNGNSNSSPAAIGRDASSSLGSSTSRDSNAGRSTNSWNDNSWSQNSQSSPGGSPAAIGASKPAVIGSANNSAPGLQPPSNSPSFGSSNLGSAASNFTPIGGTSNGTQPPLTNMINNPGKLNQAGTSPTGEPQQWVTFTLAVLFLVGSLAANFYLGWSYLDARQKYQALVRRTADTFRRTKQPVAA